MKYMEQLKKTWKNIQMTNLVNFTKRLLRLIRLSRFNFFVNKKSPKLSEQQIDELIELNKDILTKLKD